MNVLDLAMDHGLHPVKVGGTHGGEYASACPFCGGNDRFRIWPEQNDNAGSYWCRGCNAHGDRIQFVMDTQHVKFPEAARITGDDDKLKQPEQTGARYIPDTVRIPSSGHAPTPRQSTIATPPADRSIWIVKAGSLVTWAKEKLTGSDGSTVLLNKGVGESAWIKNELGYIPEDIYRSREAWGMETVMVPKNKPAVNGGGGMPGCRDTDETAMRPKRLWIPAGIVIPHRCPNTGHIDRIRIRRPSGEPRYYVVPGSTSTQMILGSYAPSVVIVESELDAILIDHLASDITVTIALGSSHAKPDAHAASVIGRASCVLVALDNDLAGATASAWWLSAYKRAHRWPVPGGKDPSDAHMAGLDIREWIIAGWPSGLRSVVANRPPESKAIHDPQPEFAQPDQESPQTISELYALLRKNRAITVSVTDARLSLDVPETWKSRNYDLFARMSRLIYFDPDVFGYLHRHGAPVITCDNFY